MVGINPLAMDFASTMHNRARVRLAAPGMAQINPGEATYPPRRHVMQLQQSLSRMVKKTTTSARNRASGDADRLYDTPARLGASE